MIITLKKNITKKLLNQVRSKNHLALNAIKLKFKKKLSQILINMKRKIIPFLKITAIFLGEMRLYLNLMTRRTLILCICGSIIVALCGCLVQQLRPGPLFIKLIALISPSSMQGVLYAATKEYLLELQSSVINLIAKFISMLNAPKELIIAWKQRRNKDLAIKKKYSKYSVKVIGPSK